MIKGEVDNCSKRIIYTGPPDREKLICKCLSGEAGNKFYWIKNVQKLDKWVGESEKDLIRH